MKIIGLALSLVAVALSGCAGTANVPLDKARAAQLAGSSLVTTRRERADFANMKASTMALGGLGGAVGGAIAGASTVKAGNELIAKNNIPDPAVVIARELTAFMATRWSLKPQSGDPLSVKTSDLKELATSAGQADLLLDVQTLNWSTIYLPTQWNHYRVLYSVRLRLIDTKKQQLLAQGFFAWKTPDEGPFPSNDELYADNGEILRTLLDQATKAATEYFRKNVLAGD
jgi:hypothetical protein